MTIPRNLSFLAEGASSTGVLGATYGGTGQSSITTGDLLYGSASNTISKLAIGSTSTILRVVAGVPTWGTDYTGTVTSVAATAGTGISITGSPITSSGTLNITNTAPDQTVALTAGTGISTTGTYPNFTITNTSPSVLGPTFSAYADTTTQTLSTSTYTKILFQTKEYDTASKFTSSTTFTPNVAGYYQVSSQLLFVPSAPAALFIVIYKNGSAFKEGCRMYLASGSGGPCVSALIYLNGSTDYIEIYALQSSGVSTNLAGGGNAFLNYFQAVMVRGA